MTDEIKKAQDRKAKFINKAIDKKELSIIYSGAQRDAVLVMTTMINAGWIEKPKEKVGEEVRMSFIKWRDWFIGQWDSYKGQIEKDIKDTPPYTEEFLIDALKNKTYKSPAQKAFFEAMGIKWYGWQDNGRDMADPSYDQELKDETIRQAEDLKDN